MEDKIIVSPFEYAIREVAEPETLDNYRAETIEEKEKRLRTKFERFFKSIKIIKNK